MPRTWTLPPRIYDTMAARAASEYPFETVGAIFGDSDCRAGSLEVVPLANIQNDMHERDPEGFPRDARTAYYVDQVAFFKLQEAKQAENLSLQALYHSHPDHEAYFSKKDREDAAPPDFGEPLYPGCTYIVFSVKEGRVAAVKGYEWSQEERDFVEIEIVRGD